MAKKTPPKLRVINNRQDSGRVERMVVEAANREARRYIEGFGLLKDRCESPIEELLMAALYESARITELSIHFMNSDRVPEEPFFYQAAFVYQQAPIGPYRVDILFVDATLDPADAKHRLMVVECDGHDFHERTKEQARRDKQRDRYFQSRGIKVLRYTGSEIWADPDKCAEEIIDELAHFDDWRAKHP